MAAEKFGIPGGIPQEYSREYKFSQIKYEVDADEGFCFVTMNRPKYRNAVSRVMHFELDSAFKRACEDPHVKVILLLNGE